MPWNKDTYMHVIDNNSKIGWLKILLFVSILLNSSKMLNVSCNGIDQGNLICSWVTVAAVSIFISILYNI
jgi:hypothetical protein